MLTTTGAFIIGVNNLIITRYHTNAIIYVGSTVTQRHCYSVIRLATVDVERCARRETTATNSPVELLLELKKKEKTTKKKRGKNTVRARKRVRRGEEKNTTSKCNQNKQQFAPNV